jgi:hypothetical protein
VSQTASRKPRSVPRNATAAILTAAAAVAGTAAALRLEPFAGPGLVAFVVFVFPVPVACGLAGGLVSPRRAILWAPVYAAIVAVIAILLLVASVQSAQALAMLTRLILGVVAIVISAVAAFIGERIAAHGWSGKAAVGLALGCGVLVLAGNMLTAHRARVYEQTMVPQVLLEIDADYVALPRGATATCRRDLAHGCYRIHGTVAGRSLIAYAAADAPSVLGIRYRVGGRRVAVNRSASALAYLKALGFRDKLLGSLSQCKGSPGSWCAGLELTRLTLEADGVVTLEPFPSFDARRCAPRKPVRKLSD